MAPTEPQCLGYAAGASQLYIAISNAATHQACVAADQLTTRFLKGDPPAPTIILDLDGCGWIDSTFAGWIIRLKRQVARQGGRLVLTACPEACRASLDVMGLSSFFEFRTVARPPELTPLVCAAGELDAGAIEFMARAHESLAELKSANARAFAHIAEQLRTEARQRGG